MAKKTKPEAQYGMAKAGGDRCAACRWYEAHTCEIVDGDISPDGWCKFFHAKAVAGPELIRRHDDRRREMDAIRAR